jgi:acetyl-CoA acyltransferase 1
VITWVKRTALTKDTPSDALLTSMLQSAKEQAGFDTDLVEDIVVGTCHPPSPCYESRAAALAAGFAEHTPVQAVNRLCGSGLMAIRAISDSVARGDIEIGLAVGVESMTWK